MLILYYCSTPDLALRDAGRQAGHRLVTRSGRNFNPRMDAERASLVMVHPDEAAKDAIVHHYSKQPSTTVLVVELTSEVFHEVGQGGRRRSADPIHAVLGSAVAGHAPHEVPGDPGRDSGAEAAACGAVHEVIAPEVLVSDGGDNGFHH